MIQDDGGFATAQNPEFQTPKYQAQQFIVRGPKSPVYQQVLFSFLKQGKLQGPPCDVFAKTVISNKTIAFCSIKFKSQVQGYPKMDHMVWFISLFFFFCKGKLCFPFLIIINKISFIAPTLSRGFHALCIGWIAGYGILVGGWTKILWWVHLQNSVAWYSTSFYHSMQKRTD